ncbi:MAG: hypothetical protein A2909_02700 [Candidatus Tagabacteria bacterium RIFCSPLOWO2_01_FULL_39_11]|uniref:MurNAc-LAA domain-containing protein n=1 Tax=Candidatus Tagabacteria bacterium RIFCSPLOWO2_01_FULL_39_11 TaxID=1802295 RepID=A0A1G2LRG1_9BACT|nr:MAG: hypothetical protein A2909_02700 [Candidatus Tagabacteria bacterium RIFCSPLOWO2_01_FULL_39_11]
MKNLFLAVFLLSLLLALTVSATSHLTGKIIALDAGHGSSETDIGTTGYCNGTSVKEVDVNLKVRSELKTKLETDRAIVFEVPPYSSRKERVEAAEAAGANVLISIHHNGSTDTTADYTQTFITQNRDKKLANPVHQALVAALGLDDAGIKHDGYGMTVYGSIPSILTEAYFITDTDEACNFLTAGQSRVQQEVGAFYDGLNAYFSVDTGGGGSCSPGQAKQGKC